MNNRYRWTVVAGGLLLVAIVGAIAFYFGMSYGMEDGGRIARDYRWHPWPFGFFAPFFFIFVFFIFLRGLFWGGRYHRRCAWGGVMDGGLDEWHRRAHERMGNGEREQQDDPDRRR